MLVEGFKMAIFPYIIQLASILAIVGICSAGYDLFRNPNIQKLIDRLKAIFFAYAIIKGAWTILAFIDLMINNINLNI